MNHYRGLRVLVTGGAGFIGSHLVEALVHHGAHVTVLDDLSTGNLENLSAAHPHITFLRGSITDYETCLQATRDVSTVFHLAAFVSVPQSVAQPLECHRTNVTGTLNLLEACRHNSVERFVFSSSSAVYGNYEGVCDESAPCNPTSPYGLSKLLGEHYCRLYAQEFGLKTVCLRYFNVFGERQNPHGTYAAVIAKFRHQLHTNQPITIFGDGSQTRDFIPVQQVVAANLALAQVAAQAPVYNVATGVGKSLIELVADLKKEFAQSTSEVVFAPARHGDIVHSIADCSKLKSIMNSTR